MTVKLTFSQLSGSAGTPLIGDTIGSVFNKTAAKFPDHLALVSKHQNIRWSYSEYKREVDRLATGLLALGVKPGDRVGIWAPNCVEWCLVQFATASIGAIMVCINPAYRLYELEYALNKVQCKVLISASKFKTSDYLGMINQLVPELSSTSPQQELVSSKLPHLKMVICLGAEKTPGMWNFPDVCNLGQEVHYAQHADIAHSLCPTDAINIQFTSGTTGNPKGATLSHRNILNNGNIVGDGMLLTEHDRLCLPVPLYHCFGMVLGNLTCITHGSAVILPADAFDPVSTLKAVEEEKCTGLHGVPTMFIAELESPEFDRFDLSSLRTGIMAGAPCPVEIMKQVLNKMHMQDVLIGYGQTELSPINHMTSVDDSIDQRVGSVGKPSQHTEVRLVDENNQVVPIGVQGEICTRGYSVMIGYWDDEERTADTIDTDGWLHSGDLGIMDEQGYVQVVGRIKDMIIRGGENVYPREVEEFLYTHPDIQAVQVFGIPDQKYGEQVAAWIKLHGNHNLTIDELKEYCRDKITHFKIPSVIEFVDEFPMTVTGKVQKFKMRDAMIKKMGL